MQHTSNRTGVRQTLERALGQPVLASIGSRRARPSVEPFCTGALAAAARTLTEARAQRPLFFKETLFSDPAWDILLELLAAEGEGKRHTITSVGLPAKIATTTALRWINALEHEGLVAREDDPLDARRSFLTLTDDGLAALTAYFQNCRIWGGM